MSELRAFIKHVSDKPPVGCGLCVRGARNWCQVNGVDFRDFLHNGFPVSRLDEMNDAFGNRVAAAARAEQDLNRE